MRRIRRLARYVFACLLQASGALKLARGRLRRRGAVLVLALHRVLDPEDFKTTLSLPGTLLTRGTFERLAAHLVAGFQVTDALGTWPGRRTAKVSAMLTFDDGWIDNYSTAFPIARQLGVPMHIFVCPGLTDREAPFWPERIVAAFRRCHPTCPAETIEATINRLKQLAPEGGRRAVAVLASGTSDDEAIGIDATMAWAHIRELADDGVIFGSHSQTHQILTRLTADQARFEAHSSKAELEGQLGTSCELFAYPNGNHSAMTRSALAQAGYSMAFTMEGRPWTADCDPLAIPRINIAEDDVTGPGGRFSAAMFEYTAVWKASRR